MVPRIGRRNREIVGFAAREWIRIVHQAISPEILLVEKDFRRAAGAVRPAIKILGEATHADTEFFDYTPSDFAVGIGTLDRICPAVANQFLPADTEFIALRVPAKIIVIVQDEDAGFPAIGLAIEVSGGETADATTNNDEIVGFTGILGLASGIPEGAVAKTVGGVEGTGMAPAHAGKGWGIVIGRFLRAGGAFRGAQMPWHHSCARGHRNAIDEVPARDPAMHSQFAVPMVTHDSLPSLWSNQFTNRPRPSSPPVPPLESRSCYAFRRRTAY